MPQPVCLCVCFSGSGNVWKCVCHRGRRKGRETENNKMQEKNSMCKSVGERQRRWDRRLLYMVISCLHFMATIVTLSGIWKHLLELVWNVWAMFSVYIFRLQLGGRIKQLINHTQQSRQQPKKKPVQQWLDKSVCLWGASKRLNLQEKQTCQP